MQEELHPVPRTQDTSWSRPPQLLTYASVFVEGGESRMDGGLRLGVLRGLRLGVLRGLKLGVLRCGLCLVSF